MKENLLSRRNLIQAGGISLLNTVLFPYFGKNVFAAPSTIPFEVVRFAVLADIHYTFRSQTKSLKDQTLETNPVCRKEYC